MVDWTMAGFTRPPKLNCMVPMLQARDLRETIEFYTQVLGFTVQDSAADLEGKPYWCCLKSGGAMVMFYSSEGHQSSPAMTGVLYFYPEDLEGLWEQLKSRVQVEWPLQTMQYGMREFAIRDCNGYTLSFGQSIDIA